MNNSILFSFLIKVQQRYAQYFGQICVLKIQLCQILENNAEGNGNDKITAPTTATIKLHIAPFMDLGPKSTIDFKSRYLRKFLLFVEIKNCGRTVVFLFSQYNFFITPCLSASHKKSKI